MSRKSTNTLADLQEATAKTIADLRRSINRQKRFQKYVESLYAGPVKKPKGKGKK